MLGVNTTSYLARIITLGMITATGIAPTWAYFHVGDTVTNFTLTNWNGQPISLFDYSDRFVFLNFWYTTS